MTTQERSAVHSHSLRSEEMVAFWLRQYFPDVHQTAYADHFDVAVAGKCVEVKVGIPRFNNRSQLTCWRFNIHRRGRLSEVGVDAYVLRLESVPGFKAAVHLIVPAPIGRTTLQITLRSLLTRWGQYYNRFDFIDPARPMKERRAS